MVLIAEAHKSALEHLKRRQIISVFIITQSILIETWNCGQSLNPAALMIRVLQEGQMHPHPIEHHPPGQRNTGNIDQKEQSGM
jgi:hypothetical protein